MKKGYLFLLFCLINLNFLFAENWTLGATKFLVEDSSFTTEAEKSGLNIVSTQLPSLILDAIPINLNRTVYPEEIFQRDLYKIEKDRQSFYSSLTSQIKNRDTLIFSYTGKDLEKKIESSEKNILSYVQKIEESKTSEFQLIKNFYSDKKQRPKICSVVLYQNDSSKLFDYENSKSKEKVNSVSIHGLITGKIISYGEYMKVESSLTLYPEGKVLVTAKEVGLVSEVEFIANSIMNQFLSSIINENLVQTEIFIYPQEAGEKAVVFIEDLVLRGKSVSTKFTPGEHSIRIESPGYETIYFSHNYLPGEDKTISINMKKIENLETYFTIDNKKQNSQFDLSSEVYLNSLFLGNSPISVLINNKTYLGEVVSNSDKKLSSFFVLKNGYNSSNLQNTNVDEGELVSLHVELPEAKYDLSKRIDKSRKRMYWSYGGLILSLPIFYFAKGNYEICQENSLIVDDVSLQNWKTASDVSMYTLIGSGINFFVQLVLYLIDANRVVPKTIEPKIIDFEKTTNLNLEIAEVRQLEESEKIKKELEEQKRLEEQRLFQEKKLIEENNTENFRQEIISTEIENENSQIENINSKEGE